MKALPWAMGALLVAACGRALGGWGGEVRAVEAERHLDVAVYRLRQSQDGRLWAATAQGVYVHGGVGEAWKRLTGHPLLDGPANDVLLTTAGELWVGTDEGLLVRRAGGFETYKEVPLHLPEQDKALLKPVLRIVLDEDSEKGTLGRVVCLAEDGRRRIWVGTERGPVQHEPQSGRWTGYRARVGEWVWQSVLTGVFAPFAACRDMLQDARGRLWCLTDGSVCVATSRGPWCLWQPGWRVSGAPPGWGTYVYFAGFHGPSIYGDAVALALGPDGEARVLGRKAKVARPPEIPTTRDPASGYRVLRPRLDTAATEAAARLSAATALAYGGGRVFVGGKLGAGVVIGTGELATRRREVLALAGARGPVRDLLYDPSGVLWVATGTGLLRLEL